MLGSITSAAVLSLGQQRQGQQRQQPRQTPRPRGRRPALAGALHGPGRAQRGPRRRGHRPARVGDQFRVEILQLEPTRLRNRRGSTGSRGDDRAGEMLRRCASREVPDLVSRLLRRTTSRASRDLATAANKTCLRRAYMARSWPVLLGGSWTLAVAARACGDLWRAAVSRIRVTPQSAT